MVSGPPQSHRPAPAEYQRLEEARGRLRDALGGVSNLDQLLHSRRVGPKALVTVLPDVAAACADIRSAADELLGVFERYLPTPDAVVALRGFVHPHVQELERELASADARPMNAKNRLLLETIVDRASQDLGSARWLIDLLDEALWSPPVRLKLHDLVREASKTPVSAAESVESVAVTLASAPDGGEVLISPRVGMGLVGIAVAFVASKHPNAVPHIEITTDGQNACGISIRKEPGEGSGMMLVRRPLIAPSLPCLETVAALTGARVNRPADGSHVSLSWYAAVHDREHVRS
jgi:hypothetical protein